MRVRAAVCAWVPPCVCVCVCAGGCVSLCACPSLVSIPLLLPFAAGFEARSLVASGVWSGVGAQEGSPPILLTAVGGVLAGGAMSFLLILLELAIVRRTSALSTDVIGYVFTGHQSTQYLSLECPLTPRHFGSSNRGVLITVFAPSSMFM